MKRFKVAIPWILAALGVRKWIAERFVHIPESVVSNACDEASKIAGTTITIKQWRAVELTQAATLYDGILVTVDHLP